MRNKLLDRLSSLGADVAPGSAQELERTMHEQLQSWGRKVREVGIQPE
jgi:hypothetical protein